MFMYGGLRKRVKGAVSNANLLMQNHNGFLDAVEKHQYTMTEVDSDDIKNFMIDRYMNQIQKVVVRYHWNPFSKMIASFNPRRPDRIKLNAWKIRRGEDSIVGSIIHEYVHLVDNFYEYARFGHGDNYGPKSFEEGSEMWHQKFNSAPYHIGKRAKEYSEKYID